VRRVVYRPRCRTTADTQRAPAGPKFAVLPAFPRSACHVLYASLQFTVAHIKPAPRLRLVQSPARAATLDPPPAGNESRPRVVTAAESPAPLAVYTVRRCILCGDKHISATNEGRMVTVQCLACDAIFAVEYDPPDSPTVRGRIEIISRRDGPPRVD